MKHKLLKMFMVCFFCTASMAFAQNKTVTGRVTSKDDGLPIPGVTVKIKGSTKGAITNTTGRYTISAPAGSTLVFSFIGYTTAEVPAADVVDIALASSSKALTEVVVVGYGTTTKQAFTGTAKQVSGDDLNKKRVDNVTQALAGEVAGVRVINTSGQPGTVATVRIRGFGSINGNRDPLYVVDGVPLNSRTDPSLTSNPSSSADNASVNSINMADVESITVLKDATATAIYGSRGANGVVLITTKNSKNKPKYIEVDVNFGSNSNLIPRYKVITSPEEYAALSWQALYNQGLGLATPTTDPVAYANARLFSSAGLPPAYNLWNSTGANLIDPNTRQVKAGVTRKYDPEKWEDYAFQHAARTETNLRLGGSSDKSSYFMSLGYLNDKGYSIASDYKRYTGRVNLTSQIKPWLNASMNLSYAVSKQNTGGQTSDSGSIFWFIDNIPSIYPLFLRDASGKFVPDPIFGGNQYDYGGNYNGTVYGRKFASLTNSIADTKYNTNRTDRNEVNGNVSLNAKIIDGLTFENTFGTQYYNNANVQRNNKYYGSAASQNGSIFLDRTDLTSYNLLDLLRYKKAFGDHSFEALAAHEITSLKQGEFSAFKFNLVQNDSETLDNAVGGTPASSSKENYNLDSYFAQVNYDYKQKYFLSGTVRRDGSSKFAKNRWGTFGSVGAGWLISSEKFMESQTIFSSLKLKTSYGLTGDQAGVPFYSGRNLSNISNNGSDGISLAPPVIASPDLTWETSKMFQVAVEFSLGKYIDASVDYYDKNTKNQFFDRRVGISNGYAFIRVNDGKVRNKGIEFDVTGHILKGKDYHFDLGINGEILKNKITAMPVDPSTGQQQVLNQVGNYGYSVGHSIYDFYTKQYQGVNPANGNSVWNTYYVDLNGDGKPQSGTIEAGTGEYIASLAAFPAYVASHQNIPGINKAKVLTTTEKYTDASLLYTGQSAIPSVRGAINLNGGYKGFDLSIQVLYSLGGYAYDSSYANLMTDGLVGNNNWSTDILNAWKKPGDITNVPRLSNNQNANVASASTRFVTKADYLALNNVRLSYTFNSGIYKKLGLSGLSLWVSGDNLYLASKRRGFNPSIAEDGGSSIYQYATLSTISAGLKAKF